MSGEATLLWAVLFGAIGMGYFVYGKRQREAVPLVCGIGLMVFPYFVDGTFWTVTVGAALACIPWCIRR